jgi:sugar phosphate isomerase/epimerase
MQTITRRAALSLAAAPLAFAKRKPAGFDRPLGVELYTVRDILPKEPERVLGAIASIGYKELEGGRANLGTLVPAMRKFGLTMPSVSVELPLITGEGKPPEGVTLESAIDQAKAAGAAFIMLGYSGPQKDADGYKRVCEAMNRSGATIAKAGMQLVYHNHAYEFGGEPGQRAWDYYVQYLDPKLVPFQLDVFWLSVAGQDPAATIRKYAGRVAMVHLKDKAFGAPVQYDQNVKPYTFREVGTGVVDFPAVLRAAEAAGVKHYFVEQDRTPGDPLESLQTSYRNLRALKL